MVKKVYIIFIALLLFACNSNKEKATVFLESAQKLYEQAEYELAKNNLDSIKILYPKEFKIQKKGLMLRRYIEIKEQELKMVYFDSLLNVRVADAEKMKKNFIFEKNPEYDDLGKYIDKNQQLEDKLQSSYIRSNVNELGEMFLFSVYYGSRPIRHSRLKISKPNGEYAETLNITYDGGLNYSFVDGGMTTEVVTYSQGKDNGVIQFIYSNKDSAIKAEYLGREKFTLTISPADKNVLMRTYDLSIVLSDIEKLKTEKEKCYVRMLYLESKLIENLTNDE